MKKLALLLFLGLFVVPQITLAAWWNPLSWFGSRQFLPATADKNQLLEDRIKELEDKLNEKESKKEEATPVQKNSANKPVQSSVPTKPVLVPNTQTVTATQPAVRQAVLPVDINKNYNDLIEKFAALHSNINEIITSYHWESTSGLTGQDYYRAGVLNSLVSRLSSSLYDLKSNNPAQSRIDYYSKQYNEFYADFNQLGINYNRQVFTNTPTSSGRENSSQCISAREAKDRADAAMLAEQQALRRREEEIRLNSSGAMQSGVESFIQTARRESLSRQADLSLTQMAANSSYSLYCLGSVNSSSSSYSPPVRTYCDSYGNGMSCVSY